MESVPSFVLAPLSSDPKIFRIESFYHRGGGLVDGKRDVILYRRNAFEEQFEFMQKKIIDGGILGWILGAPGTGKSVTGFAFGLSLDRAVWDFIWVKLDRDSNPKCTIFEGNQKFLAPCTNEMIINMLKSTRGSQQKFLIIDGFVRGVAAHEEILRASTSWRDRDQAKHRLSLICSLSTRGKKNDGYDLVNRVEEFLVCSWLLGEYLLAVCSPDFAKSVSTALGCDSATTAEIQELVKQKHYFAGGCARYMFGLSTSAVKKSIDDAVETVSTGLASDFFLTGPRGLNTINRLFSLFRESNGDNRHYDTFVSRYAASALGLRATPAILRSILTVVKNDVSGSSAGGVFETMFCWRLRSGGVSLRCRNGTSVVLAQSTIEKFDTKLDNYLVQGSEAWLKPESETNPGYDLVYVNKPSRMARFVQLARGDEHKVNLEPCKEFIAKLDCVVKIVEICFVVRINSFKTFKLVEKEDGKDAIKGRGALETFRVAGKPRTFWKNGAEVQYITILGMEDVFY